jgi:hypothetical protein
MRRLKLIKGCCKWRIEEEEEEDKYLSTQSTFYLKVTIPNILGPGVALQVDGSRDRFPVVSLRIFSGSFDSSMCPGVDSASKNEYQENSWE